MMDSQEISNKEAHHIQEESPGRRKWLVLLSGYFVMFLCPGFAYNMSVLNSELLRSFGKSKAETALVQSTTVGVLTLGGAMSGKFVAEYGARITGITASAIVTLGMVLSFFATNIPYLITTLGLVSGMGFSASVISALTSVGEYFEENARLMALSFVSFGTGCGAIVVPYILQYLIAEFGWRGCLLIIGGLLANMACCFGICKPLSVGISKEIKHVDKDVDSPPKENTFVKSLQVLLSNKVFILYVVALCCALSAMNSSMIFIIDILIGNGFKPDTAMLLNLFFQLGNLSCRFVPALCKKYIPHTNVLLIPAFFTLIGSIVTAFFPHAVTYTQYSVILVFYGMTYGVCTTSFSVTTMKLVNLQNYSAGMGLLMTLLGISSCISGPIKGLLTDQTGSYTITFYSVSAELGLATCLFISAAIVKKKLENKPPGGVVSNT